MVEPWPRLYARGFFLAPQPVDMGEDLPHFEKHLLPDAVLYRDSITDFGIAVSGEDWLITLGKMLPLSTGVVHSHGPTIAEDLLTLVQREGLFGLESALYDIGGRYAVVIRFGGKLFVYNDAAGHRTVYYDQQREYVASHFDMLHRITGVSKRVCPVGSKNYDAHPEGLWDVTENPEIKALLPNHRLELKTGQHTRFGLIHANPYRNIRWSERVELIHRLWHEQLEQVFALNPNIPVGLSLSGGLDSRTMLAHMKPYLNRTRAFTYTSTHAVTGEHPKSFWERTMTTDFKVLQQLQDHLPTDFHVIVKANQPNLSAQENEILARNTMRTHARRFIRPYHKLFPDLKSIHLRGNLVELGRLIRGRPNIEGQHNRLEPIIRAVARRRSPDLEAYTELFWDKVDEFQYDLLHEDTEFTDVYHWENRSSRWYGEVANESDTVFDSIVPVNVRRIYELLISPPVEIRQGTQLQYDLIHHAWPELLAYGINTEQDLYTQTLRPHLAASTHQD